MAAAIFDPKDLTERTGSRVQLPPLRSTNREKPIGLELGLGEEIEVEFTPPYSSKPIRVRSEVRNRNGYRYGVELVPEGMEERSEVTRLRQMLTTFEARSS